MELATLNFGSNCAPGNRWIVPFKLHSGERVSVARRAMSALPATTDFSALVGKRLLCLVDEDNLRISLKDHGRRLSYQRLMKRLKAKARSMSGWAVLTAAAGDHRRAHYLKKRGWDVLRINQETVMTVRGLERKANADFDLAFLAGHLVSTARSDTVVIGTGDGDLAISVARGLKRIQPSIRVFSMSIPGSTCHRLLTRTDLFDGNFLVGLDITRTN